MNSSEESDIGRAASVAPYVDARASAAAATAPAATAPAPATARTAARGAETSTRQPVPNRRRIRFSLLQDLALVTAIAQNNAHIPAYGQKGPLFQKVLDDIKQNSEFSGRQVTAKSIADRYSKLKNEVANERIGNPADDSEHSDVIRNEISDLVNDMVEDEARAAEKSKVAASERASREAVLVAAGTEMRRAALARRSNLVIPVNTGTEDEGAVVEQHVEENSGDSPASDCSKGNFPGSQGPLKESGRRSSDSNEYDNSVERGSTGRKRRRAGARRTPQAALHGDEAWADDLLAQADDRSIRFLELEQQRLDMKVEAAKKTEDFHVESLELRKKEVGLHERRFLEDAKAAQVERNLKEKALLLEERRVLNEETARKEDREARYASEKRMERLLQVMAGLIGRQNTGNDSAAGSHA